MLLTKIDCDFFGIRRAGQQLSSYIALNPTLCPGNLVVAESSAVQETIGSQVACRVALEHFVDGVLRFFGDRDNVASENRAVLISEEVLEAAFKRANQAVYELGHKLAAGNRMAASLIGLVVQDQGVTAARVGGRGAYLVRGNKIFPFFDDSAQGNKSSLIGAGKSVVVELASIALQPFDGIVIFSKALTVRELRRWNSLLPSFDWEVDGVAEKLRNIVFGSRADQVDFSATIRIGPGVVYLKELP